MKVNWGVVVVCFVVVVAIGKCSPKDDTDPPDGRSGMGLRTDHRTGCQYLTTLGLFGESAIIPRLDASGKQICSPTPPDPTPQEVPDGGR